MRLEFRFTLVSELGIFMIGVMAPSTWPFPYLCHIQHRIIGHSSEELHLHLKEMGAKAAINSGKSKNAL